VMRAPPPYSALTVLLTAVARIRGRVDAQALRESRCARRAQLPSQKTRATFHTRAPSPANKVTRAGEREAASGPERLKRACRIQTE